MRHVYAVRDIETLGDDEKLFICPSHGINDGFNDVDGGADEVGKYASMLFVRYCRLM